MSLGSFFVTDVRSDVNKIWKSQKLVVNVGRWIIFCDRCSVQNLMQTQSENIKNLEYVLLDCFLWWMFVRIWTKSENRNEISFWNYTVHFFKSRFRNFRFFNIFWNFCFNFYSDFFKKCWYFCFQFLLIFFCWNVFSFENEIFSDFDFQSRRIITRN